MISGLLLHLRKDTHARMGVISAYEKTGIRDVYVNEDGIEYSKDLIAAKNPQVIVIHDEPDFMDLAEAVGELSPRSLNIMDRSAYINTGIKIREKSDYERLRELGFAIYCSGFNLNTLCEMLKEYNDGRFRRTFGQWIYQVEPFEAMKENVRDAFEYNYYFI